MSHVSAIETTITDLDSLEAAANACGLEMIRGKTDFKWYGRWVNDYHGQDAAYKHGIKPEDYGKCEHVLRIKGDNTSYEVGVIKKSDGSYQLIYDHWGSGQKIAHKIGFKGELISQQYTKDKVVKELKKKGFTLAAETSNGPGKLQLKFKGPLQL